MGLFGSTKTKIYVASSAVNLSNQASNVARDSVIQTVLEGEDTFTRNYLSNVVNSIVHKTDRAYRYAQSTYTHGLPQGTVEVGKGDDAAVTAVLEALEGTTVQLIYNVLDNANPDQFAYWFLSENRGWTDNNNIVTQPPFSVPEPTASPVYFVDAAIPAQDNLTLNYTYTYTTTVTDSEGITTTTEYTVDKNETVTVADIRRGQIYYHVKYVLVDAQGKPVSAERYWSYRAASGVYPSLTVTGLGNTTPFYPIVPLRWHNQDMAREAVQETELYQTSKKLLDLVGLDIHDLADNINDNPDVGDIDHAFLFFGVGLQTENKAGMRYLAEFFEYLSGVSDVSRQNYYRWEVLSGTKKVNNFPPGNRIKIEDAGLRIDIAYSYIDSNVRVGSIGKIGTVTRTNIVREPGKVRKQADTESGGYQYWGGYDYEKSEVIFKRQVTKHSYIETRVYGPVHTNYVYGSHDVETRLSDSVDPDDHNFIVPLNRYVYEQMSLQQKTDLHYDTLQLIFNSYEKVKVKWYEQSWFKFAMIVITVAISIATGGAGAFMAKLTAAAAQGAMAVLTLIVKTVLISMAISYAFKILVKALGMEIAIYAAMILSVYTLGRGIQMGGLKGVPFADELLFTVNGLNNGIQANLQDEFKLLEEDAKEFEGEAEEKEEALEAANELLETSDIIDPFTFIEPVAYFNPDESPDAFYNRTVHSGNVGALAIEAISQYVEIMLQLPTTNQIDNLDTGAV